MADITQIFQQFKTERELKQFCEAQYKTILELSEKLRLSEEKNKSLQDVVLHTVPVTGASDPYKGLSNEEIVCLTQIKLLKHASEGRELTLEEAKKLDIYTKVLFNAKSNKSADDSLLQTIDEAELLRTLTDERKP